MFYAVDSASFHELGFASGFSIWLLCHILRKHFLLCAGSTPGPSEIGGIPQTMPDKVYEVCLSPSLQPEKRLWFSALHQIAQFWRIQDCSRRLLQNWCGKSSLQVGSHLKTKLCGICGLRVLIPHWEARSKQRTAGRYTMSGTKSRRLSHSMYPQPPPLSCFYVVFQLRCYFGAAHGIAGILHTLLQLPAELALALELRLRLRKLKTHLFPVLLTVWGWAWCNWSGLEHREQVDGQGHGCESLVKIVKLLAHLSMFFTTEMVCNKNVNSLHLRFKVEVSSWHQPGLPLQ